MSRRPDEIQPPQRTPHACGVRPRQPIIQRIRDAGTGKGEGTATSPPQMNKSRFDAHAIDGEQPRTAGVGNTKDLHPIGQNFGPAPLTIKLLILSAKLRFQCRPFPGRFGQVGPSQFGRDATQVHGFRQWEPEPMGQPAYKGKHLQPAVDLRSSVRSGLIIRGLTKAGAGAA